MRCIRKGWGLDTFHFLFLNAFLRSLGSPRQWTIKNTQTRFKNTYINKCINEYIIHMCVGKVEGWNCQRLTLKSRCKCLIRSPIRLLSNKTSCWPGECFPSFLEHNNVVVISGWSLSFKASVLHRFQLNTYQCSEQLFIFHCSCLDQEAE